ncbi:MAG: hypothetical protein P4L84_27220 [Isosphaeraceae bacterium]|nr:hypothetical protein [Isosphaeraceae bacterium]
MEFIRIKEDIFRLDMITRIREGRNEETFYGRSVRKGTEAWLDIYFVGGEVVKLEGESAMAMRRFLEQSCQIKDVSSLAGDSRLPSPHTQAPSPPASTAVRGRGPHG